MAKQGNSEKCKIMSKTCLLIAALVVVSGCPRQSMDKNMTFEAIKSVDAVQVRQYLASGAAINLKKITAKVLSLSLLPPLRYILRQLPATKK
jgi:hypothetical protein